MFRDSRYGRAPGPGCLDLFGERGNFDLPWRFELFGGIPCFFLGRRVRVRRNPDA